MTRLQQLNRERDERNEMLRADVRERLRSVLRQLVPVDRVVIFGSLTKPHCFTGDSDIDIALETEPAKMSLYQLTALLAEEMGRPVDIVVLSECRFRSRIDREGEIWMLSREKAEMLKS
jgi:predicted nucleotidyltransferase